MIRTELLAASIIVSLWTPRASAQERHEVPKGWQASLAKGHQAEKRGDRLSRRGRAAAAKAAYRDAMSAYLETISKRPKAAEAYARLGRMFVALRAFNECVAVFSQGQHQLPNDVPIRRYLGVCTWFRGNKQAALAHLIWVSKRKPTAEVLLLVGRYLAQQRRCKQAVPHLSALLKLGERVAERRMLADCLMRVGRFADARESYEKLVSATGGKPFALWGLARAYERTEAHAKAEATYRRLMAALPENKKPDVLVPLAEQLRRQGRYDEAARLARRYVSARPKAPGGHQELGLIALSRRDCREALGQFELAVARGHKSAWAHSLLSRALRCVNQPKRAITASERAAALSRDPDIAMELGNAYRAGGRYEQAIGIHDRLLRQHPKRVAFRLQLANDYLAAQKLDSAIREYNRLVKNASAPRWDRWRAKRGLSACYYNMGVLAMRKGQDAEASRLLTRAQSYRKGHRRARLAQALLALRRKDGVRALQLIKRDKKSALALWIRGRLALDAGKLKQARTLLRKATRARGGRRMPQITNDLAVADAKAGKLKAANARLESLPGDVAQYNQQLVKLALTLAALRRQRGALAKHYMDAIDVKRLAPREKMLHGVLAAATAIATGAKKRGIAKLSRLARDRNFSQVAAPDVRRSAARLIRAKLAIATGKGIPASMRSLARVRGARARKIAQRLRMTLRRLALHQFYRKGRYRRAAKLAGPGAPPALQHDAACAAYRSGDKARARAVFARLQRKVPEATVNLGIAVDELDKNRRRAFDLYRRYLKESGGRAKVVRRWIEAKKRIYGFR
ncbi:MAG: tetratricopeptide repeat protein [Myxococcales bacterium]|nr:tetratricopeptide repeat protein [Myxococcales bacterium]